MITTIVSITKHIHDASDLGSSGSRDSSELVVTNSCTRLSLIQTQPTQLNSV